MFCVLKAQRNEESQAEPRRVDLVVDVQELPVSHGVGLKEFQQRVFLRILVLGHGKDGFKPVMDEYGFHI